MPQWPGGTRDPASAGGSARQIRLLAWNWQDPSTLGKPWDPDEMAKPRQRPFWQGSAVPDAVVFQAACAAGTRPRLAGRVSPG